MEANIAEAAKAATPSNAAKAAAPSSVAAKAATPSNIVAFPGPRRTATAKRDQRGLLDAVYAAGSLPIAAADYETKTMAARLQIFGFFVIDEIETDGTARRMRASETIAASLTRPWRVSKPTFGLDSLAGSPDAAGLFTRL